MEMLLKFSTTPTEYELQIQHAKLERSRISQPILEISREKGGLTIQNQRAQLRLDTYEARSSLSPTVKRSVAQYAKRGIESVQSYSAKVASETAQMKWSKMGEGGEMLHQLFTQRAQMPTGEFQLGFLPTTGVDITYQEGNLQMDYQMDRLNFDLKVNNGTLEYTPGSVDLVVTQKPNLHIEYIGDPLYVPPSAGERFLGQKMDVVA